MPTASSELDEQFMRRAIRLAMNGRGRVEPNPMVGCVIVREGRVIGEGFHARFGGPHAEPAALANCTESPAGATAYVTLEPCCHTNKKTPPCAPRLIEAGLARVVIGCLDPHPEVNGKGAATLRAAGVRVDGPVLEGPAKQLIALFQTTLRGRCYVTAKWAETADRKVAGPRGARRQISGPLATRNVHILRARSNAMMVGVNTVLNDDPLLTARDVTIESHLDHTVVLDTHLRTPPTARLFHACDGDVVIYCGTAASAERERVLAAGPRAVIQRVPTDSAGRVSIADVLKDRPAMHILVEPGPTLAKSLFETNAIDRLWVIRSPAEMNDQAAPRAADVPESFVETGTVDLAGDRLTEYLNPASPAFFAPEPSADFVLAGEPAGQ